MTNHSTTFNASAAEPNKSKANKTLAYIGLGSNLEQPQIQIEQAASALNQIPDTQLVATSPLYQSKAIGPGKQADYINAVAALETCLSAPSLLLHLQTIENLQGRQRGSVRWVARTLDLDLLLFGDTIINTPDLTVPHPRMAERNFVLYPLLDLANTLNPNLALPEGDTIVRLAKQCPTEGIRKL